MHSDFFVPFCLVVSWLFMSWSLVNGARNG